MFCRNEIKPVNNSDCNGEWTGVQRVGHTEAVIQRVRRNRIVDHTQGHSHSITRNRSYKNYTCSPHILNHTRFNHQTHSTNNTHPTTRTKPSHTNEYILEKPETERRQIN